MKKIASLIVLLTCTITFSQAQQDLVAAGNEINSQNGSASYTIGQVNYTTSNANGTTISRGVQQAYEISLVAGIDDNYIDLEFATYPNPTTDFLMLSINGWLPESLSYELMDMNGKVLSADVLTTNETSISLVEQSAGNYFLKVLDRDKQVKVFKVIKK